MTQSEQKEIRQAIKELMSDDDLFMEGMERLCKLIGIDYPAARVCRSTKVAKLADIASGLNRRFKVKPLDAEGVQLGGKGKLSL